MQAHQTMKYRFISSLFLGLLIIGNVSAYSEGRATEIFVNNEPLSADDVNALEQSYGVRIRNGRYWYDPVSGAWGFEGGPTAGQILPGLALGGSLRADASSGNTGVFINGRQLHPVDVAGLQRCTTVLPGRYWVNAQGLGGYEGGPPLFNLAALCSQGQSSGSQSSSSRSWYNGDGSWSYHSDITGISMIGGVN